MLIAYQIADYVGDNVKKTAQKLKARFTTTDSQLLEKAKKRDTEAFSELVRRNQNFVYRTALGYIQDSETAKDVTQDVFLKAYKGLPYFRDDSQFTTWLYKICKNQCLNLIRHRKLENGDRIEGDESEESQIPLKVSMKKMIALLEDEFQEIIMLRYFQDLKYDEIARYLDIPISTVKIRLYRAKRKLKKLYGDRENNEMR